MKEDIEARERKAKKLASMSAQSPVVTNKEKPMEFNQITELNKKLEEMKNHQEDLHDLNYLESSIVAVSKSLTKLKELLDAGILTEEEFKDQKAKLLQMIKY